MIRGNVKFDGLVMGSINIDFITGPGLTIEGKAAFVSSVSGHTHGWTTNKQWSPAVLEKIKELRDAMEVDMGRLHLLDGGETLVSTARSAGERPAPPAETGGLGDHVGSQV